MANQLLSSYTISSWIPVKRRTWRLSIQNRVQALASAYETWFDDVTADLQRNEGMPHPTELNPIQKQDFRFTWQDWWGDKTGWSAKNYGRWRMNNPGLIERFDVTVFPAKAAHWRFGKDEIHLAGPSDREDV